MDSLKSVLYTIGDTPTVELANFSKLAGVASCIYAKIEYNNPTGSVTDRAALYMINEAVKKGAVHKNTMVVEASGGNMGVSVAFICKMMGFACTIVAPETILEYNADLIASLGARLVLTEKAKGIPGAIVYADNLCKNNPDSYMLRQFGNEAAITAYHDSLAPELRATLGDDIDVLVCAVGSGSTLSGSAQYLKKWNADLRVVAVEPRESGVLSGGLPASHGIQGIGVGFIPDNYNQYIVDKISAVSTGDAVRTAQLVWTSDGIPCGYSGGATVYAAAQIALENPKKALKIAVVIPDASWRYKGTRIFKGE